VIDIDVSTKISNDAVFSPTGISDESAVRITLVTGRASQQVGTTNQALEAIESTLIFPRNTAVE
jgi:hypothetical protein